MNHAIFDDVHAFWFGELEGANDPATAKAPIWFRQDDDVDAMVRDRFGSSIAEAADQEWDLETLTRQQRVGLVILLDQFPRNIYRQSGDAFAYDASARAIAEALIAGGLDSYFMVERNFTYMPLMHSEEVGDQDHCTMLFAGEAVAAAEEQKGFWRNGLDFATKHRDLIRKFGRFPHRNAVLGRTSTPEEEAFMAEKGRGF